jgi:DNA-directed RNA polymerase subunit alpha
MPGIEGFAMPQSVELDEATATPVYAKFVAEPWEKGFGHTIGNALRRVLMSSMEGVAVTSVRIDGVPHEFSSVDGVVEDVTEIILNLKRLHLKCAGELPRTIELFAEKTGPVTAANVREDGVTTVLNPDLLVCTLSGDQALHMELEIDRGRGFRPAVENKREDHAIGVIAVDSLFSPVERVRYDVQECRVGQRIDYDRLEFEVWTDGRIAPQDALKQAALLVREHLNVFLPEESAAAALVESIDPEDRAMVERLCTSVDSLELSVRAKNCLDNADITTVGQLVVKSESEMLKYRNFGKKSLQEIKSKLADLELTLAMTLKEEVRLAFAQRLEAAEEGPEPQ